MEHWHSPSSIIRRLIEKDNCVNIAGSRRRWSCWKCEETKAIVIRRRKKFQHPPLLRQDFTLDSTLALNLSKPCLYFKGLGFQVHQVLLIAQISFFFSLPPTFLGTYPASQACLKHTVVAQVDLQLLFLLPLPSSGIPGVCVSRTRLVCCWVSNPRFLYAR